MLTYFISKKFIVSKKNSGILSLISVISISGIALGVAIVIVAISILNGFENVIAEKIINFNSHIKITAFGNRLIPPENNVKQVCDETAGKALTGIFPFIEMDALVIGESSSEGVKLFGLSNSEFDNFENRYLLTVRNSQTSPGISSIMVGSKLAAKLSISHGDTITVATLRNNQLPSFQNPPAIGQFIISGIFESGMAEYDDGYIITHINEAQKFLGLGDKISGYNLQLNSLKNLDLFTKQIAQKLRYPFFVRNLY